MQECELTRDALRSCSPLDSWRSSGERWPAAQRRRIEPISTKLIQTTSNYADGSELNQTARNSSKLRLRPACEGPFRTGASHLGLSRHINLTST